MPNRLERTSLGEHARLCGNGGKTCKPRRLRLCNHWETCSRHTASGTREFLLLKRIQF